MMTREIFDFFLPLDGFYCIAGLPTMLNALYVTYTPGWREALLEQSVLPKSVTQ